MSMFIEVVYRLALSLLSLYSELVFSRKTGKKVVGYFFKHDSITYLDLLAVAIQRFVVFRHVQSSAPTLASIAPAPNMFRLFS